MRIPLQSRTTKILLLSGCILPAVLYFMFSAVDFLAAHFAENPNFASLSRAVRLQPRNAEYQYRLGRYLSLAELAPAQAEAPFRAAVALNPHQARYWMALAGTYQSLGDDQRQGTSLERALNAEPTTPEVAWEAANFYIVRGDTATALKNLHVVLANDPYLPPSALRLCWKINPDADFLLREVVPPITSVNSSFLEYLISENETVAAAKVWDRLIGLNQPIDRRYIFEYVRYLATKQQPDQAKLVWQKAANLSDLAAYQPSAENLVVNGDFNQEILNAGFDWMYQQSPDVSLTLDPTQFHSGHGSLHLEIDTRGIEDAGIRQLIAVSPNTSYQFSAYFKAESLEGAGGLHFVVQDLYSGKTYFTSEDFSNVDFWKQIVGSFSTEDNSKLAILRIQRLPARSPIKGRLWVDGVRLYAVRAQGGDH
ncbi:MAG TPA: carbohydrate binding domain-containing protein [Terriglobales bacterium]|nr:carbohydrate binding domain-containing protein [Terriglobales bacterium]